ncbi:hypothetical protein DYBT9275_04404 [Dyadobacter sp. CECT 9275]|uniref:DUF2911 domain-containing protein n=1 Tax=Dyadobacter helix TaxID=2822344 RepID=A0A916JGM5_9BACT|nr:DUF2911 domain-containing protein [Dyadobacter sp. CECT 9275]CAG5009013.1 hypothetical protein DYBT9275_04404 [Dyadobacter sp. CECT 9275]
MNKTLLIILSVCVVCAITFFGYRKFTKSFSPESQAEFKSSQLDVKATFSRPGKKGRFIFGREQDKALVPYGKVWRTGANEATVIEIGQGVLFAGKPVAAGTYSLWTIPGQGSWEVILNSETGQWGTEYNDGKDILKSEIPIRIRPVVQELFDIYFEEKQDGADMILSWDQTEAIIPIRVR